MASFVGSMFGAGSASSAGNNGTGANRGQNTSAPPRVQQHPWPFNRTLDNPSRRYRPTRHETPDPFRHRHGSGARTDPQPSSNRSATPAAATPRDRSRERQPSEAPGLSALAARQNERDQEQMSIKISEMSAAITVLQERDRLHHSRLGKLEDTVKDLEQRSKAALTAAEASHKELEKKTREAFDKAAVEYAKAADMNARFKILELELSQLWEKLRDGQSGEGDVPQDRQEPRHGNSTFGAPAGQSDPWWPDPRSPHANVGDASQQAIPSTPPQSNWTAGQQAQQAQMGNQSQQGSPFRAFNIGTQQATQSSSPVMTGYQARDPLAAAKASAGFRMTQPTMVQDTMAQPTSWGGFQHQQGMQHGFHQQAADPWTRYQGPAHSNPVQATPASWNNPNVSVPQHAKQYMGNQEQMDRKNESLRAFNGSPETFKAWAQHMIDHMARVHPAWRPALEWMAQTDENLEFARLNNEVLGPYAEPAHELAVKFEQVLVDWIPESLYQRRTQLCGGPEERNNGFIMWRRLHSDNVGSEVHIANAGIDCLREYGRCTRMSDLMGHLDGWKDLMTSYGQELDGAPSYVRSMYLDIIPKELKTEISKEPSLEGADWKRLDQWVRRRCMVLQTEKLADINRRVLQKEFTGRIHALQEASDDDEKTPPPQIVPQQIAEITATLKGLQNSIAAIQRRPTRSNSNSRSKTPPRGRSTSRGRPERRQRSSSGGKRLIDWGKKCYHCGKDDHTRNNCRDFQKMMENANKGNLDKKTWKVPPGYESAIAKARKAAKATEATTKGGKMNAITSGEDTGSEDEDFDKMSMAGRFSIAALRPVNSGSINSINKFAALDQPPQEYSDDAIKSLNCWAAKVRRESEVKQSQAIKKAKSKNSQRTNHEIEKVESMTEVFKRQPKSNGTDIKIPEQTRNIQHPVMVRNEKDLIKVAGRIAALPSSRKGVAKAYKKISDVDVAEDEMLAMVDSGSFIHAIDAENCLPGHNIEWFSEAESKKGIAETACGGLLKRLGMVRCKGTVDGHNVEIQWNHMRVKCPILSVLRLTQEGN